MNRQQQIRRSEAKWLMIMQVGKAPWNTS
jgi:hypothetical protein